jgi:hypothetical protein
MTTTPIGDGGVMRRLPLEVAVGGVRPPPLAGGGLATPEGVAATFSNFYFYFLKKKNKNFYFIYLFIFFFFVIDTCRLSIWYDITD